MDAKKESTANEVVSLLLNRNVQQELIRINPTFNRAELVAAILDAWGGQETFAKDVFREFREAPPGSPTRKDIMKFVTVLISEESKTDQAKRVEDLTDDELNRSILAIAPSLTAYVKGDNSGG